MSKSNLNGSGPENDDRSDEQVYLSLGSNIGDRLGYLEKAVNAMQRSAEIREICLSPVYETEPLEMQEQPRFLNMVTGCRTPLDPEALLERLKEIEESLGRHHREPNGPREIDIDIIFYGQLEMNRDNLQIPHPRFHRRKFVLVPLHDLAPEFISPIHGMTVNELLKQCPDESQIQLYDRITV